ncbi:hypothetical protein [Halarcobacter anaerophilus]|uniref:Uncharacterized protein n=1 Tax=Halarcobacter anaerophilus TaxID=877500 RepID=A0A4Q0Y0R0_9BACT|nr:hypothetical protein [Halarcobacter anaerophilus]QDF28995.1 hypothetical protein AANAER_1515 [Halarcobacter anaerophilus]RXJ63630.1 hypothetical protein CRV06_05400 [Halarcobacter anaerophilus]
MATDSNTFLDWANGLDFSNSLSSTTEDATTALNFDTNNIMNKSLGNNTGQSYTDMYFNNNPSIETNANANTENGFDFSNMFTSENLGGTLKGIGAVGGALASIYGASQQKKFNEDMLDMEKKRVNREYAKADAQQAEYDAVWKS